MTEYATEDIATRNRHAGSLFRPLYMMASASEEPNEYQRRLVSLPGATLSSVLTHRAASSPDYWGAQGTITTTNYATDVSSGTVSAATCFAHIAATEYLDSRNIAISNFGLGVRNVLWTNEPSETSENASGYAQARSVLLSDEVLSFCSRWQIFNHFQRALRLAQQSFLDITNIEVQVESDPESEDEWLMIVVQVHSEIGKVLDMYDTYTKGLVRVVPWPARDRIRLICDFV
jgi:hypothetical protein